MNQINIPDISKDSKFAIFFPREALEQPIKIQLQRTPSAEPLNPSANEWWTIITNLGQAFQDKWHMGERAFTVHDATGYFIQVNNETSFLMHDPDTTMTPPNGPE